LRDLLSAEACVIETRITPKGENIFGEIQDGVMRIRGRVADVPADIVPLACHRWHPKLWHIKDQDRIIAYCNIDCAPKENVISRNKLLMLMLMSSEGTYSWEAMIQQWNRDRDRENFPSEDKSSNDGSSGQ
jgi:hypothetical protein